MVGQKGGPSNCFRIFRVEKYRPSSLNDVISHEDIVDTSMITGMLNLGGEGGGGHSFKDVFAFNFCAFGELSLF